MKFTFIKNIQDKPLHAEMFCVTPGEAGWHIGITSPPSVCLPVQVLCSAAAAGDTLVPRNTLVMPIDCVTGDGGYCLVCQLVLVANNF